MRMVSDSVALNVIFMGNYWDIFGLGALGILKIKISRAMTCMGKCGYIQYRMVQH